MSGAGVWATHFIAMMAYDYPIERGLDGPLTLLSGAVGILFFGAAYRLGMNSRSRMLTGGALFGIGIAEQEIDSIFEEFVQADMSLTRRYDGTGIGLSITRHLITLLGGQIDVQSTAGAGTTFHVTHPLTVASANTVKQNAA